MEYGSDRGTSLDADVRGPAWTSSPNGSRFEGNRINSCHNFDWSRKLWTDARNHTLRVGVALCLLYFGFGYHIAYQDGMRAVDIYYFLVSTLTTVGLGDFSPTKERSRAAAVLLMPLALLVITFGISTYKAFTNTLIVPVGDVQAKIKLSVTVQCLRLLLTFATLVVVGTLFFIISDKEWDKQNDASRFTVLDAIFFSVVVSTSVGYGHRLVPLTDEAKIFMSIYMLVATTSVAYIIDALAEIYIRDVAGKSVVDSIIESTVWVHKADLDKDGQVDEADYCLFKLQQMMKVDRDILERLERRYDELDIGEEGELDLGLEIPSAGQVKRLQEDQARLEREGKSKLPLSMLWQERRSELGREFRLSRSPETGQEGHFDEDAFGEPGALWLQTVGFPAEKFEGYKAGLEEHGYVFKGDYLFFDFHSPWLCSKIGMGADDKKKFRVAVSQLRREERRAEGEVKPAVMISKCDTFTWSRQLWAHKARELGFLVTFVSLLYVVFGLVVLVYCDSKTGLDSAYLLSATLSSVGYGDYAPVKQVTRAIAIVLIPFGMVLIALVITWSRATHLAAPPEESLETLMQELEDTVGEERAEEGLSLREMLAATRQNVTDMLGEEGDQESDIAQYYRDGSGRRSGGTKATEANIARRKLGIIFNQLWFKSLWQLVKLAGTAAIGAIFFKFHPAERDALDLSWTEAFYFAMTTTTTVGYGDIVPSSRAGKTFATFYMLFATVVTAEVVRRCVDIYVGDFVGEGIIRQVIDSTTWVHKSDLRGKGFVTQAEYILFKLQQLQSVDLPTLDRLVRRFGEIDSGSKGYLQVGIDIPSAEDTLRIKTTKPRSRRGSLNPTMDVWTQERVMKETSSECSQERIMKPDVMHGLQEEGR